MVKVEYSAHPQTLFCKDNMLVKISDIQNTDVIFLLAVHLTSSSKYVIIQINMDVCAVRKHLRKCILLSVFVSYTRDLCIGTKTF